MPRYPRTCLLLDPVPDFDDTDRARFPVVGGVVYAYCRVGVVDLAVLRLNSSVVDDIAPLGDNASSTYGNGFEIGTPTVQGV